MLRKKTLLGTITAVVMLFAATVAVAANFTGTPGPDTINGTATADDIKGLGGDDTLSGRGGNDIIDGGSDDDTINGDGNCPAGSPTTGPYACIPGQPGQRPALRRQRPGHDQRQQRQRPPQRPGRRRPPPRQ